VCILQVRCGVALECEHAIEVEAVVAGPIRREIRVLDCPDADDVRDVVRVVSSSSGFFSATTAAARVIGLLYE
jgi:hypothetical protein